MSERDDDNQAADCPWCQNQPADIEVIHPDTGGVIARVTCDCGVCGPWSISYSDDESAADEAVNVWNEVADA